MWKYYEIKNNSFSIFLSLLLIVFEYLFLNNFIIEELNCSDRSTKKSIKLDLTEDLHIEPSKDKGFLFYGLAGIVADSKGNIYLLDIWNYNILKFNKNGVFIKTIGRKGEGPGEFLIPFQLSIDLKDNLYVCDLSKRALIKFDSEGRFLQNIKYPSHVVKIDKILIDSDFNILCGYIPIGNMDTYKIDKFDQNFHFLLPIYEKKEYP